jgi:hypothetical protein
LFGDFELHGPSSLLLDHGGTVSHLASYADVVDAKLHEVTAPQLAVDREIEQREIACSSLQLQPNADGPDLFRFQRALLVDEPAFVPRSFCKADH